MKAKSYTTQEVLAVAVAVFEHNDHYVIRSTTKMEDRVYVSNRQLISEYLDGSQRPFVVSKQHQDRALDIQKYLEQTYIMQNLRDGADRFLSQINLLCSQEKVTEKELGLMAWAPKVAVDYERKDQVREVSARYEYVSRYVGRLGETIETPFTLIDSRYITSMDCWAVYGADDDGNLIFYWAKNRDRVCETGSIRGRVKSHREDAYRNDARVTALNYVKVL